MIHPVETVAGDFAADDTGMPAKLPANLADGIGLIQTELDVHPVERG